MKYLPEVLDSSFSPLILEKYLPDSYALYYPRHPPFQHLLHHSQFFYLQASTSHRLIQAKQKQKRKKKKKKTPMQIFSVSIQLCPTPISVQAHQVFNPNKPGRQKSGLIRCCSSTSDSVRTTENYYELLGIPFDSNPKAIKEAYRKLQKKHHPDIAGQKGHEYTLKLNEAYDVLMRDNLRREYDLSTGKVRGEFGSNFSGVGYSSWNGPVRPHALFVDENACIGCRECVHHACNTFAMDEALGCARVKVQFGDDDNKIAVSVDSCPVNCIHWVEREDLPVLEFIVRPQPIEEHGVYGGGWERPSNIFSAAEFFKKQLKEKDGHNKHKNAVEEETPAQAEARASATMKLQMDRFSSMWLWVRDFWSQKIEE